MNNSDSNSNQVLWLIAQSFLDDSDLDAEEDLETARFVVSAIAFGVYNALHAVVQGYELPSGDVIPVIAVELAQAAEDLVDKIQEANEIDDNEDEQEGKDSEGDGEGDAESQWLDSYDGDDPETKGNIYTRVMALKKAFRQSNEDKPETTEKVKTNKRKKENTTSQDDDPEEQDGIGIIHEDFLESEGRSVQLDEILPSNISSTTENAQQQIEDQILPRDIVSKSGKKQRKPN